MKKRSIVAVALAAAATVSLGLAGCSSGGTAQGGSTGSGAPLPVVKMMVGGIDKQIYLPYQLAQSLGYYKKYGVDMQLSTEQNGGVGAEDAMVSGQVDMAGAWYIHTVDFQSKGKKVISIAQMSGAPGERIMCNPKAHVSSGADLKGKTVGVTDLGSGTDELTQFIAQKGGVQRTQYKTVAVHAGATAIAALQQGTVDCAMTTQPTVGALESKKIAVPAIDLATTKGATAALGGAWPAAAVLANESWVNSHKKAVQSVVTALVATMHWIHTHTAKDVADKLPQAYVQNSTISKSDYISGLQQDYGQFLPDALMPAGGPKTIFQMEKALGVDTSGFTYTDTFTNSYVQTALKQLHITPSTTPAGAAG